MKKLFYSICLFIVIAVHTHAEEPFCAHHSKKSKCHSDKESDCNVCFQSNRLPRAFVSTGTRSLSIVSEDFFIPFRISEIDEGFNICPENGSLPGGRLQLSVEGLYKAQNISVDVDNIGSNAITVTFFNLGDPLILGTVEGGERKTFEIPSLPPELQIIPLPLFGKPPENYYYIFQLTGQPPYPVTITASLTVIRFVTGGNFFDGGCP